MCTLIVFSTLNYILLILFNALYTYIILRKPENMTEYWKSQARKYCQFCSCWFADNKVSISFHENGKRHKENVQKHISQLTKKSAKEFKKQGKIDDDMKKMEDAAMAAYLQDVQNNADITSQNINEMLEQSGTSVNNITVGGVIPPKTKPPVIITAPTPPPIWHEVATADGSYFWNTQTNETTWDPPDEYLSLAQQEKNKSESKKEERNKKELLKQKQQECIEEVRAHMAREQMRELVADRKPPETEPDRGVSVPVPDQQAADDSKPVSQRSSYGPAPRAQQPYGKWTTVSHSTEEKIDLQLPKSEEVAPPPVVVEPERVQFKEKRVESLGEGPVEFKRRKLNISKRNIRQKLDDE